MKPDTHLSLAERAALQEAKAREAERRAREMNAELPAETQDALKLKGMTDD